MSLSQNSISLFLLFIRYSLFVLVTNAAVTSLIMMARDQAGYIAFSLFSCYG
jgi:hypothetical protein